MERTAGDIWVYNPSLILLVNLKDVYLASTVITMFHPIISGNDI